MTSSEESQTLAGGLLPRFSRALGIVICLFACSRYLLMLRTYGDRIKKTWCRMTILTELKCTFENSFALLLPVS